MYLLDEEFKRDCCNLRQRRPGIKVVAGQMIR